MTKAFLLMIWAYLILFFFLAYFMQLLAMKFADRRKFKFFGPPDTFRAF